MVGVDSPEVLEQAASLGAVDRPSTLKEARGADLVVLAAPISKVTDLAAKLSPTSALVTDVAITNSGVERQVKRGGLCSCCGHG